MVTPSPILKLKNLLGIHLIFIFMKNLELTQMEGLTGGADAWYCGAMLTGVAVGLIGGAFAPFLGAGIVSYGLVSMDDNGCF